MSCEDIVVRIGVPLFLALLACACNLGTGSKEGTMDKYLLEAMREVDAMLPGTPPIAPPEEQPSGFVVQREAMLLANQSQAQFDAAMTGVRNASQLIEVDCSMSQLRDMVGKQNAVVLSYDERMLCNYHGVSLREYAAFKQRTGRAPW